MSTAECVFCSQDHSLGLQDSFRYSVSIGNRFCMRCKKESGEVFCLCEFPLPIFCSKCMEEHWKKPGKHRKICARQALRVREKEGYQETMEKMARCEKITNDLERLSASIDTAKSEISTFSSFCMQRISEEFQSLSRELDDYKLILHRILSSIRSLPFRSVYEPRNLYEQWCVLGEEAGPVRSQDLQGVKWRVEPNFAKVAEEMSIRKWVTLEFEIPNVRKIDTVHLAPKEHAKDKAVLCRSETFQPTSQLLYSRATLQAPDKLLSSPSSRGQLRKECAGCGTSLGFIGDILCNRAVLDCGHTFHSEDCFFEYLKSSDLRNTTFQCPKCAQNILEAFIESYFGRGRFREKVKPFIACHTCNSPNNLTKLPDCVHYLCFEHTESNKRAGVLKCPCRNNPWGSRSSKKR